MKKLIPVLLLVVLLSVVAVSAYWLGMRQNNITNSPRTGDNNSIPAPVTAKYNELKEEYAESAKHYDALGASLYSCQHNNDSERVYIVEGSGGYESEEYYYRSDGSLIGSYKSDDMALAGEEETKPPINRTDYTCAIMN